MTASAQGGEGRRATLTAHSALDLATSDDLMARARELGAEGPLDIDLRPVEFIDSSGLRALLEANRFLTARWGPPRMLVSREGPVLRMLQLTLLDRTLDVRVGEGWFSPSG